MTRFEGRGSIRRATIRTRHGRDGAVVADALEPDNTDEMETRVEADEADLVVVMEIERSTTGGLQSTVDDYVVNADVASATRDLARAVTRVERTNSQSNESVDSNASQHARAGSRTSSPPAHQPNSEPPSGGPEQTDYNNE